MAVLFDISQFDEYKEDNRREVKKANAGLPTSLWDTYSAFANCYGGVIILGIKEEKDGSWRTTGLQNEAKLRKDFWNTINNRKKVNINLLSDDDVQTYMVSPNGDIVMVINVPMAKREQKPVYINDDIFGGTFRRNFEGDYHCTGLQVKTMLRDQTENTMDMEVLNDVSMQDLNDETIQGYRNRHRTLKEGHPFQRLNDYEYLRSIGAAAVSTKDGQLHPTAAGMLMFGNEYNIVRCFPEYFLDYREVLDPTIRWTDRLQSSSGEWSGNLFDFYFRVYNKMIKDIKVPFKMSGGDRIDDTPVHKAIREALANCLINADYYGVRGIVIKRESDKMILENPGYIRTGKKQMRLGGESDPRNKALMKMFNLINIGERAGSGVPNIFDVWEEEGWVEPEIIEKFEPDRTILSLSFIKKETKRAGNKQMSEKVSDKMSDKVSDKMSEKEKLFYLSLQNIFNEEEFVTTKMISEATKIPSSTVRRYLNKFSKMYIIKSDGKNKGTRYYLVKK